MMGTTGCTGCLLDRARPSQVGVIFPNLPEYTSANRTWQEVDKVGLWRNTLLYLGFVEDDLDEDFASYRDPSRPRIIPPDALGYEARAQQPLASVHHLPVRQAAPRPEVSVIWPKSYSDVQRIGDSLRASLPVIVNLEATDGDFSRRVIAFACGLVYGLDGGLKKLGRGLYLLSPAPVEASSGRRQFGREGLGF